MADVPLAARMRPSTFEEFVGQAHLIGPGKALTRLLEGGHLPSIVLWGPAGTGKTTLAYLLADAVGGELVQLSAVSSGVGDARKVIAQPKGGLFRTVLFVDEVHRWSKAQQDVLRPAVEEGTVTLIGATTENPYYSLVTQLLSRCILLQLEPLSAAEVRAVLERALADEDRGLAKQGVEVSEEAMDHLVEISGGDARIALTGLEAAVLAARSAGEASVSRVRAAMIDFLSHLLEWSTGFPMLILCSARPELLQSSPQWGGGMRNSVIVSLTPLSDRETRTLLSSLLPDDTTPDVYDLIAERAGGNPLFAEEFVRMLQDRSEGATVDPSDAVTVSGSTPENLEALIAARLDTLDAEEKSLLQDASVIGRVFWPTAVAAVSGSRPDDVERGLRDLVLRELVRPSRVSSVQGDAEYAFSHAMIRDVAYGQIPRMARVDKHVVAAGWIERLAVERVADHAELLAHHYGQALGLSRSAGRGDLGELEEATRRALMLAGQQAMALDVARSTECFDRVLELLPADHPDRAGALFWKAEAAKDAGRYEEAEGLYRGSISAFRAGGDRVGEGESLTKLGNVLWERGAFDESNDSLATAARILEAEPPGVELATCYAFTAVTRVLAGAFGEAIELCERALELGERFGDGSLVSRALSFRGTARCFSGDRSGLDDFSKALEVAEKDGSSRESALALLVRAEVEWASLGPATALETVRTGRELAERRGVTDMVYFFDALSLGALFDLGAWDELLLTADDVVQSSSKVGAEYVPALAEPWITQVLLWRDRHAEASETAAALRERAAHIREAQVLVPAWVATALVAVHQGRIRDAIEIVEELDRETEVSLDWYRENALADLVRICVAADAVPLARRVVERSTPTAARHELSLLSADAALEEAAGNDAQAADRYERAVEGWREYGHQVETGLALLGAARCLEAMGDARSADHRAHADEIFGGLGAAPFVPLREGPAD